MQTDLYHGITGSSVGAWMFMGNREHSSGGPFFKDIQFQTTADSTEMYNCLFTGHTQTEAYRQGLQGPYAMQFTDGSAPTTPDYSWMANLNLQGWIPASQRGTLTGVETGVASGHPVTITLTNSAAQYWGTPDAGGNYSITGIQAGTYTETLYQDQLQIGTRQVTITGGNTTTANITSEWNNSNTIWSIGTWDGTPLGFLNSDKIQIMHPTDVRMNPWPATTTYTIGTSTPDQFPMIQAKDVNNSTRIVFTLTAAQAASTLTLRIGDTFAFAGGRPVITVNAGTANTYTSAHSPAPPDLNSRGITRGTWRGFNLLYTYNIPSGKLVAGSNTIDISVASGSSGTGFLSPNIVYDAIDLVANQSPALAAAASASPAPVTGTTTALSVLGADDSREANLVYTWTNTGPAAVTYSDNADNTAKNTIAIFHKAGTYIFTASIKDPSGSAITSNSTVTVTQTPSGFGITPAPALVLPGATLQLLAGTVDQFNQLITPAANTTWSLLSGPGTLSPSGLFVAPATPGAITSVQVNSGNLPPAPPPSPSPPPTPGTPPTSPTAPPSPIPPATTRTARSPAASPTPPAFPTTHFHPQRRQRVSPRRRRQRPLRLHHRRLGQSLHPRQLGAHLRLRHQHLQLHVPHRRCRHHQRAPLRHHHLRRRRRTATQRPRTLRQHLVPPRHHPLQHPRHPLRQRQSRRHQRRHDSPPLQPRQHHAQLPRQIPVLLRPRFQRLHRRPPHLQLRPHRAAGQWKLAFPSLIGPASAPPRTSPTSANTTLSVQATDVTAPASPAAPPTPGPPSARPPDPSPSPTTAPTPPRTPPPPSPPPASTPCRSPSKIPSPVSSPPAP